MEAGQTAQRNGGAKCGVPLGVVASMEAGQTAQRNQDVLRRFAIVTEASMEAGQTAQRNGKVAISIFHRLPSFNGGRANRPA